MRVENHTIKGEGLRCKQPKEKARQFTNGEKNDHEADTSELEHKIDELVYKLYGLTEDEIAIVEGK